jgi:uncharacterized BrkB/YihY/UPF0761 family membrane protein
MAERLAELRARGERLPGAPFVHDVLEHERDLGGGLIAGGVAFRIFLWLVPLGLVIAALLSFWSEADPKGLADAAQRFGIGAAAAGAAAETLQGSERSATAALLFGLVFLAWFTLGAARALILAYALAWQLKPRRIGRPHVAIAIFNGLFLAELATTIVISWLREQLGPAALLAALVSLALTMSIALTAMWHLPNRATHPRELVPGALLVAVGEHLLRIAVVFYFAPRLGRSEETYGAFGAAATMLVWLYVLSRLLTGAAFLNATLWDRRRRLAAARA